MSTTPNMQLELPVVGSTPGPDWADLLNTAFGLIDSHDHSDGKGVKITPAGLNINADLDIGANNLTNTNRLLLNDVTGDSLSNVYQNGGDLYWRNGAGNDVQITSGSTINVGSLGTIGGDYSTDPNNPLITFTTATGDYDFYKDTTGSPIPAGINTGRLTIFEEIAGANGITVQSPTSLAAAYNIILPIAQVAASNSLVQAQGSGQWSFTRTPTADTFGVANAGTIANPSLYRETDAGTGFGFPAASQLSLSLGGIQAWLATQAKHSFKADNTATDNVVAEFENTGSSAASIQIKGNGGDVVTIKNQSGRMDFEIAAGEFYQWEIDGTVRAALDATRLTLTDTIRTADGTVGAPAFDFNGNAGFWWNNANSTVNVAIGGTTYFGFKSTAFNGGGLTIGESANTWANVFTDEVTTDNIDSPSSALNIRLKGVINYVFGASAFQGGGIDIGTVSNRFKDIYGQSLNVTGDVATNTVTASGNLSCADITATGINTDNTRVAFKRVTGIFPLGAGGTVSINHGLTRDDIVGVQIIALDSLAGKRYTPDTLSGSTPVMELIEVNSSQVVVQNNISGLNLSLCEVLLTYRT